MDWGKGLGVRKAGIKRDKTMADKLSTSPIMVHKIFPTVDYNYWLKRLDTKLNEPTNQNLTKVTKVVEIRKLSYKIFFAHFFIAFIRYFWG